MSSCRSQIPSGTARAARSRSYAYGKNKFFELLAAGRRQEAETVQRALPPIREREARQSLVDGVNHQTITNADRFVFSPFESTDIAAKLQGESQTWVLCSRRLPLSRRATKTRRAGDLLLRPDQSKPQEETPSTNRELYRGRTPHPFQVAGIYKYSASYSSTVAR